MSHEGETSGASEREQKAAYSERQRQAIKEFEQSDAFLELGWSIKGPWSRLNQHYRYEIARNYFLALGSTSDGFRDTPSQERRYIEKLPDILDAAIEDMELDAIIDGPSEHTRAR